VGVKSHVIEGASPLWLKFYIGGLRDRLDEGVLFKGDGFVYIPKIRVVLIDIRELIRNPQFRERCTRGCTFAMFIPGDYNLSSAPAKITIIKSRGRKIEYRNTHFLISRVDRGIGSLGLAKSPENFLLYWFP